MVAAVSGERFDECAMLLYVYVCGKDMKVLVLRYYDIKILRIER